MSNSHAPAAETTKTVTPDSNVKPAPQQSQDNKTDQKQDQKPDGQQR